MNSIIDRIRSLLRPARHNSETGSDAEHADEILMSSEPERRGRFGISWLDFKVGFRMLARYPGITAVGTLAIAVAIALGTIYFEAINKWQNPRLPIPDGDRVVSIRNWDANALGTEGRSLYDFTIWREQVRTIENLGAAMTFVRNLATADGRIEPVRGAEITANAFRLMGTTPLLGRTLTEQDEQPAEPPVAVISHRLWTSRLASDPSVVGRTVKLGTATATIVGVMPEGFAFPVSERIWIPLQVEEALLSPRTGPSVSIFGRLAPGASIDAAQAELRGIAARLASDHPETHRNLSPRVTSYAKPLRGGNQSMLITAMLSAVAGIFLLLLTVVCVNVATLVFARTATRGWEITVRSALGASRGRIIAQLFIEALVLAGLAALLGLVIAKTALTWGLSLLARSEGIPFWIDDSMSWRTVLYTAFLTLFGAAIVGILPALRATRMNVQDALRSASAASSGMKFGGFWTTVIVVQVALTVALLPLAAAGVYESNRFMQRAEGIGAERYLTASIGIDREDYGLDSAMFAARARVSFDELERQLRAEPGVRQVTFADRLPVMDQFKYQIEVDTLAGAPPTTLRTSTLVQVSDGFFDAFGSAVVAGRDFAPADFEAGNAMIVNESFARHVFGGRNVIGQRVRIVSGEVDSLAGEEWYEIIGMVEDFGWQLPLPHEQSAMYRPRRPTAAAGLNLAVLVDDPVTFGPRLRTIAADVDPTIRLTNVQPLTSVGGGEATANWALTSVAWLIAFIVLLLSATGIHALMSFTVARRTREIGIRAALGARPGRIVAGVFSRAFLQITAGIIAGSALAALLGLQSTREVMLLLAADAIMLVIGLTACAVPLRRALRIQPTEALKAEV
jgi:putative ABC transport system permease protein